MHFRVQNNDKIKIIYLCPILSLSKNKNAILIKNKTLHYRTNKVHKNKVQNECIFQR